MPTHKLARLRRTILFMENRAEFLASLFHEIELLRQRAKRKGLRACLRLNGSSDIPWEKIGPEMFKRFPEVKFYDYTKSLPRMMRFLRKDFPRNYYLTFSRSEVNESACLEVLGRGGTVAAVFAGKLPKTWHSARVIDGDRHDARFWDRPGVIVGLSAKGKARRDFTGFVVRERMVTS